MTKIIVLGPQYSYSYNLATEHYTSEEIECAQSIGEVFEKVSQHTDHRGIVPIENMINGSVRECFLNLKRYSVSIQQAFDYQIENILASNGTHFTKIASHPQPLAQCSAFLRKHSDLEILETSSTSKAMEIASRDDSVAAIGNEKAALHYGVAIRERDISDTDTNITRFIEITSEDPQHFMTGEKTSMMIRPLEDRAGILFEILSVFRIKNINLTKIESIPTGLKMNDYVFYIDIDGAMEEKRIQDAVTFLKTFAEVDVFGSYSIVHQVV